MVVIAYLSTLPKTFRYLTTRIKEQRKGDTSVEDHIRLCDCDSGNAEFNWKIIDWVAYNINLVTFGTLPNKEDWSAIDTRDEF